MGVPGFFLWLYKNYRNNSFVFVKEKLLIKDLKEVKLEHLEDVTNKNEINKQILEDIESIDYFLIDTNCLIHPMCFKILAENPDLDNQDKLEKKMIEKVIEYIEHISNYVKPKKGIFIAIDGVAPVAKIKQQRSRRFKSIHDKELYNNIRKKHNKPIPNSWNNSAITPGTEFMEKLHYRIINWSKTQKVNIIYSSCNTPSEGEHKLLQFIRSNQSKGENYKYVLYGLDADLIFLALSTSSDHIYLLREANQINKNESEDLLNFVSIKIMRECIKETMVKYYQDKFIDSIPKLDKDKLISDFIFLCYFLGNDFLPHLPSLDIHKDGIEDLIETYIEVFFDLGHLIDIKKNNKIKVNNEFLTKIISKLAEKEENILKAHFAHKRRYKKCDSDDTYEREIFKIDNLQFKIQDPIQLGLDSQEEWRRRYYKYYFGCTTDESIDNFAKEMVKNYIIGMKWVTQYYFDKCPSWDWYFQYEHPPFLSDINKFLSEIDINKIDFVEGKPLKPFVQLLCVLPQQSSYLLPYKLRNLTTNAKSSLSHLYPLDFEQDFISKTKYWMGIPLLPSLEIDLVKYIYNKYQDTLSKEEQFRNRLCDNYFFNS
jgi:5'-3' exonuclease